MRPFLILWYKYLLLYRSYNTALAASTVLMITFIRSMFQNYHEFLWLWNLSNVFQFPNILDIFQIFPVIYFIDSTATQTYLWFFVLSFCPSIIYWPKYRLSLNTVSIMPEKDILYNGRMDCVINFNLIS